MKLIEIKVNNFRGIKGDHNAISFDKSDIIFLIGQNNVGKSSILKAYDFFIDSKRKAEKTDFFGYDTSNPIEIEAKFKSEPSDNNDIELNMKGKEPDWISKWCDNANIIRIRKTWNNVGDIGKKETFDPKCKTWVNGGFGGFDTLLTKYSPTPLFINAMENEISLSEKVNKLVQEDFIKKIRQNHGKKFEELIKGIKELQEEILGTSEIKNLNDSLNENFKRVFTDLTLKIEQDNDSNIKLEDSFKKNHSIAVLKDGVDRKETFLQNGHGIIRQALFNFVSFLKHEKSHSNKKEYIILYEEPELFLHPKVAFKLRESLYDLVINSQYQVLCATHSPLMIDLSKPHSSLARIVKRKDETTNVYQVETSTFDEDSKERLKMIIKFNPHVCETFYSDKVLVVEGDTEVVVYRYLLEHFFKNEEIFVLNAGSKMNIPFFQRILTEFDIEHYIIHDSDERPEDGKANAAWTMNKKIWEQVEISNAKHKGIARRYIHSINFEKANKVSSTGAGKPMDAYNFVKNVTLESDFECIKWLKDIVGEKNILHDDKYLESIITNV